MNTPRLKPKTAQLMFEPVPPSENRPPLHECPMMRRRVQSAKPRISTTLDEKRDDKLSYHDLKFTESVRPKSAITGHDRLKFSKQSVRNVNKKVQRPPSAPQKVFLTLDDKVNLQPESFGIEKGVTCNEHKEQTEHCPYKLNIDSKQCTQKLLISMKKNGILPRNIPAGVASLAKWITEIVDEDVCGVTAEDCLIFIPCLNELEREPLSIVPPPQDCLDENKCKLIPTPPKPYDPKELFHYDVSKHIRNEQVCFHAKKGQIYGKDGKLMHDSSRYGDSRSYNVIQKEIQDLERLLKGIGNEDGCSVVQYQNEINILQTSIKKTFEMCDELREAHGLKESPPGPDLFDFQKLSDEHDIVISQINARREACMEELSKLEASLGMTVQDELVRTYKHL
ncbi:uncharacterized protein [Antedon mediterranea]|uniref:uncharacterized protein n=1 Tax=Antedon mediterranea TaxID=105859 RepID=UPI003AF684DB